MNASATLLTPTALADRDQRLLDSARQGDLDAFEALVRRHQRKVYSVAWYGVRDPMLAEDIAQDVFVQLHSHLARIESAAHLGAWLRRT
ncbi:MAG TPA: sigma factor, partial [Luteitalea sp.]|nr:sigma factor [Luteitalea sp.]